MSRAPDWSGLVWETRGCLGLDDGEPVPVDELVEQAKANGYDEREIRQALRGADELERGGAGLDDLRVKLADESGEISETEDSGSQKVDEAGTGADTPTPGEGETGVQTGESADSAGLDAFKDAIRFFHGQLHAAIGSDTDRTAREHFREQRGWSDDTIDAKRLGWAPASETALLDHLMKAGHDRDAILATGLFWSDLSPIWKGRLVLPYLNEDGEPVFAISRSTDHPIDDTGYDDGPAKYHKIPKPDERAVEEPIYGLGTVEPGEDVLVTEGIADAITAHQAGYACVSPVTTAFPKEARERLAAEFRERDVGRVYIVQDAEEPGSDLDDEGRLTLPQFGEGVRGAVSTAAFLDARGVETYIGELPRPGLAKVDLDDYIRDWGTLDPVLASAKPARQHPAFTPDERADTVGATGADSSGSTPGPKAGDSSSALFDLDLVDVASVGRGDRTTNPLGHHGESENYYVVDDDGETGYDHKYKATYNALTHLLVEAGERDADAPEGDLSDAEVFAAWREAKAANHLSDRDPIPYGALRTIATEDGLVDRDDIVARDSDTGEVVADPADHDGNTYQALPPGTYDSVLDHVGDEYGVEPGREPAGSRGGDSEDSEEEYGPDPRDLEATVDPRRAWDAAARVEPGEGNTAPLPTTEDGSAFVCPGCGEGVDVVRAVAIAEGFAADCSEPLDEAYPEAYRRAREGYDAPLPNYYTTTDAIAEFDAVLDVIGEVTFHHLDEDAIVSDITARDEEVSGDAVQALNPAWRLSESGESVLVFDSGTVWDADTERVLDALRFVALDTGLLTDATDPLEGEAFTEAYRIARTEYGAPLPRWEPATDGARRTTPQLPPAEDLLDARDLDGVGVDDLEAAREDVEALIREAARAADTPTVVTALPALGKTTGTIKTARDHPMSYLAPRKELQEQALEKADEWGVDAFVLPVFADGRVRDEVLNAATAYVREHDKTPLRERWSLLEAAVDAADEDVDPADIFDDEDEEDRVEVDLDRATCPTADGDHGVAWALAFHVARRLGYTPRQIHRQARGLFGAEPPCEHDHGDEADSAECPYSQAWEEARSPEDPYDLLVGSYTHAHVDSVRTAYDTGPDGEVERDARTVVLDEFVGEAYAHGFDNHADDHARWLASALREDVSDRRDMYEADLFGDEWVRAWLDGEGESVDAVDDALATLGRLGDLFDAREGAETVLDEVDAGLLDTFDLEAPLVQLVGGGDPADVCRDLTQALAAVDRHHPGAGVAEWVVDAVAEPLERATADAAGVPDVETVDLEALPVAGDLAELVAGAVEAVADGEEGAEGRLRAAVTALRGGRDGCEVLAAWADDGYAHPDAHHLLEAIATPTDGDDAPETATRVETDEWAFDSEATDGTTLDVVETGARATVVLDRNGHGARLHNPPARTHAGGEETPLVGLDATGRAELWRVALGEPVATADIHETPAERAAFLENALDLRVLEAADRPRYYSGDPETKDTDGDVALLEAIAAEYAGIDAPRQRGDSPEAVGRPAAITSKGVREVLENDSRLDDVVAEWEHFGNLAGANDLGAHRLGAVLGCQHYGDDAIERFAALDGEAVDVSRDRGRGAELSYDSDLGDEYLAHMTEDQVLQAILRFARGDSGATVVARTAALSPDLPVVGEAQVVETWSDTATAIARRWREIGGEFTVADVVDAVDVKRRQVRRVLGELEAAGYVEQVSSGAGVATVYAPGDQPGAGEVDLAAREDAVDASAGRAVSQEYHTWNVRVVGGSPTLSVGETPSPTRPAGAPPAPHAVDGVEPPG